MTTAIAERVSTPTPAIAPWPEAGIPPFTTSATLTIAALMRQATKHYERHVLAWHALGRVGHARVARQTIAGYRRALTDANSHGSRLNNEQTEPRLRRRHTHM
jgi:hypothetical protein